MKKYTTKSIILTILGAVGFGLLCGLARIHLGWFSNISDITFSIALSTLAGAMAPFLLKMKDEDDV